ncbi:MAG: hydrogenase small subunit [Solirubrobacterales bacterium]
MPTKLSRRDFLRLAAGSAAAISMSGFLAPFMAQAVAEGTVPKVIWIQGASCTGCSVSLLNTVHPDIAEVLTKIISLQFHPNVMASAGDQAMEIIHNLAANEKGKYILAFEGAVPLEADGRYCMVGEKNGKPIMMKDLVKEVGSNAKMILNIGTCSAYGGIPAAGPNPTGCVSVQEVVGNVVPYVNIAGCPPHPDWIVGTIAHAVLYPNKPIETDANGRPKMFYGGIIHDNCPRRQYFDNGIFAKNFSEPGCLIEIGCKGPIAHCDSTTRLWNGGVNWCIKAGAPCLACTEPEFPNAAGIYNRMAEMPVGPRITATVDEVALGLTGLTALGIAGHLGGNVLTGRIGPKHDEKEGDN